MTWLSQFFAIFSKPFQWWVTIAPWESGLRVRLGKTAIVLGPGPHFRIPFLDRIYVQGVRLRMLSDSGQTIATRDGKVLTVAVAIQYAIADIKKLYMSANSPEMTLLSLVQGQIAELVSRSDSSELSPSKLGERVSEVMPSVEWGLSQVKVWVTGYAYVRTYRLLMNEYRNHGGLTDLDSQSGERCTSMGPR
jgi:regulator of protease activity HflC (stomatin/prohibitin superfamily)